MHVCVDLSGAEDTTGQAASCIFRRHLENCTVAEHLAAESFVNAGSDAFICDDRMKH